jgi:predicted metal-dependent phosphoesterase TrpH
VGTIASLASNPGSCNSRGVCHSSQMPASPSSALGAAIASGVLLLAGACLAAAPQPDLVLDGALTGADHQTYKEVPFVVPHGVTRLSVEFSYTGRDQRTVIDLGIFDGERFRGWSGGNKSTFTLAVTDATPSFLPGPIRPGRWFLLLGVPNIRQSAQSRYTAKIFFGRHGDAPGDNTFGAARLRTGMAWYRGDLHMHTSHSDGSCTSQSGIRVPCPVFRTIQAAADRGLDFIAITDHNTNSHFDAMRELQAYFDRVLLIPGREITTFHGHANVFGPVDFIDFRLGSAAVADFGVLQNEVQAQHGLISINHPMSASGEDCMGCGWTVEDTDFRKIDAVEAINGGKVEAGFWDSLLTRGFRITAVGGSDNHDAGRPGNEPGGIGYPTTVVHAEALSQEAVLNAVRAGHVFLDAEGSTDRLLECTASAGGHQAEMGDSIKVGKGETLRISVHTASVAGDRLQVIEDGQLRTAYGRPIESNDSVRSFEWKSDGGRHWLRMVVSTADGKPVLLGNPIYVNF